MSVHSFQLRRANDLLAKINRDLERFRESTNSQSKEHRHQSDLALNFVISAWHLTEWLWKEKTADAEEAFGCSSFNDFHTKVREECHALQVCYELATGSKHFYLREEKKKAVQNTASRFTGGGGIVRSVVRPIVRSVVRPVVRGSSREVLTVTFSDGSIVEALSIFEQAADYWNSFTTSENEI